MRYCPSLDEYLVLARQYNLVPIYRQLIGDTLTPVSAFCKIQEGDWAFLFESVVGGERLGRYSFLGAGPFLRYQAWDRRVQIQDPASGGRQPLDSRPAQPPDSRPAAGLQSGPTEFEHPDPLRLLEERLSAYRAPHLAGLPRFCGGAVGYAGY